MFGLIRSAGATWGSSSISATTSSVPRTPPTALATTIGVIEYDVASDKDNPANFEEKLRKLENLRKDSLISEEECKGKRKEMMNEK